MIYTVKIQASDGTGQIWQTLHPAENTEPGDYGPGEAAQVAADVSVNQNIIARGEGDGARVCVWEGEDADTGTPATYVLDLADA